VSGLDVGEGARDRGVGLKPRMDGGGDSCVGISLCRDHDRMLVYTVVDKDRVRQLLQLLVLQEMTFCHPRIILGVQSGAEHLYFMYSHLPSIYGHC
jgi:hypothetical protein